ncbi:MAG TPA: hypothetical protein VGL56_15770 [Fimbriimonadaceae bacterium]|jgi:hypothetical protein
MRRLPFLIAILALATFASAYHRRPNHTPPAFATLTDQQREAMLSVQKVMPEVGTVDMKTNNGPQMPVPAGDSDASENVSKGVLPATTHTGSGILKQVQEEITKKKETLFNKLPGFACILAFLFLGGYVLRKYLDMAIPYSGKRRRKRILV